MTTMSDDGSRMCPLCAEEMDLTDQQLKPCKCGYEICVWCWHHLIEMAEKEGSEGRCPACRTPYDKERIVNMASNCERVVAEVNSEKRQKSQKSKPKASVESRKHLTSVRVIQRNLAYIMGMPANLADENLLERKEYFGQYGRVLKVSIARTTALSSQQASKDNTFSVYITYSRDEEAVRCIQAVHNFILEGKSLRACFGTTKYCHAWLRNMNCTNPDCLYLHDVGSQDDSFTKDEIITSYSRIRLPQIASNNVPRSGNVLPPADDSCISGPISSRLGVKNTTTQSTNQSKVTLSDGTYTSKPAVLPPAASWGLRVSNSKQPSASLTCNQGPHKQKMESCSSSSLPSTTVACTKQSAWNDDIGSCKFSEVRSSLVGSSRHAEPSNPVCVGGSRNSSPDLLSDAQDGYFSVVSAWDDDDDDVVTATVTEDKSQKHLINSSRSSDTYAERDYITCCQSGTAPPVIALDGVQSSVITQNNSASSPTPTRDNLKSSTPNNDESKSAIRNSEYHVASTGFENLYISSNNTRFPYPENASDGGAQSLTSRVTRLTLNGHLDSDGAHNNHLHLPLSVGVCSTSPSMLHTHNVENGVDSATLGRTSLFSNAHVTHESSDWFQELKDAKDDLLNPVDNKHTTTSAHGLMLKPNVKNCSVTSHSSSSSWSNDFNGAHALFDTDCISNIREEDCALRMVIENGSTSSVRHAEGGTTSDSKSMKLEEDIRLGNSRISDVCNGADETATVNVAEGNIISDILALDFDPWNDSFYAANNFVKILGDSDTKAGPFKLLSSRKSQSSSESRFSFARQENDANVAESSFRISMDHTRNLFIPEGFSRSSPHGLQDLSRGSHNGLFLSDYGSLTSSSNLNSVSSSDRIAGVSRAKLPAPPPGFSVPSRTPPGFNVRERYNQTLNTSYTDNHFYGSSPVNHLQNHLTESSVDVEFLDPAILAVGKGRLSVGVNNSQMYAPYAYSTQSNSLEMDPRLQLLMQQSLGSHQDLRISDHLSDRFIPPSDPFSSRFVANNSNISPLAQLSFQNPRGMQFSSGTWNNSWYDQRPTEVGLNEIVRNERLMGNKYFSGNDEHKFPFPSSNDLYNRAFGR